MKKLTEIKWNELETEISRRLDFPIHLTLEPLVGRMNFSSEDFCTYKELGPNIYGLFSVMFKSYRVANFSGGFTSDKSKYYVNIHFRYEVHEGGSNGVSFFAAYFDFNTNSWDFR